MVRKGPNTCNRENSLNPSIPGVVAKDQRAGGLAQALAQRRCVVELKEGIRQLGGVAWNWANACIRIGRPCHAFKVPTNPTVKLLGIDGREASNFSGNRSGSTPLGTTCTFPRAPENRSKYAATASETAIKTVALWKAR